jgi:hypothetical protein
MIDWIKRITPPSEKAAENRHRPFHLSKVHLNQVPTSMSDLALLFIAGSFISDSSMVSLSAKSDAVQKMIMDHIAPHYKDVKIVYVEDEVEIINMQYVKTESFQLFNESDSDFIKIVSDLYRTGEMTNWKFEGTRKISHYAVIKAKLNLDNHSNPHAVKSFITEAYIKINKPLVMLPTGWRLDDHLKESISLRFFASFIPRITLLVDDNNKQVVAIELSSMVDGS